MKRFHRAQLYNSTTGKPDEVINKYTGEDYCDFCGRLNPYERSDMPTITINYPAFQEPSYHYLESEIVERAGGSIDKIYEENPGYFYCHNGDISCNLAMIMDCMVATYRSLEEAMEMSRLRVVEKLLSEGLTVEELNIAT